MSPLSAWAVAAVLLGPGVELEWSAPARCPTATDVLADVDRLLGGRRLAVAVAVRAAIVAEDGGFAATVAIEPSPPRSLHARGCVALARAVALVIAVAVDPVALAERITISPESPPIVPPAPVLPDPPGFTAPSESPAPQPASGPTIAAAPAIAEEPSEPVPPEPPVARRAPPTVDHSLAVRGGLLLGATSPGTGVTGAVALAYALDRGLLRLEARALYGAPRRVDYGDEVGARVQALTLGLLACVAPGSARVKVPLCLGAEAGPLIGRGFGVDNTRLRADLWASGLAGAAVVGRVHPRIAVVAGAELALALRRPAFHVGMGGVLTRAAPVGVRALVGLEFKLSGP